MLGSEADERADSAEQQYEQRPLLIAILQGSIHTTSRQQITLTSIHRSQSIFPLLSDLTLLRSSPYAIPIIPNIGVTMKICGKLIEKCCGGSKAVAPG